MVRQSQTTTKTQVKLQEPQEEHLISSGLMAGPDSPMRQRVSQETQRVLELDRGA